MLVDAHTHVWRALPSDVACAPTLVNGHCDVPHSLLSQYMDDHGVAAAVLVQPMDRGYDNSYVVDCAAAHPDRFAAVCVVDPRGPSASERLAYWVDQRAARGLRMRPRFRDEASVFGDEATFSLWAEAQRLGIVVNLLAGWEHLQTIGSLAGRFPQVAVLLDHMGHPDVHSGRQSPEFQRLLDLAAFPNVSVKLSGFYHFDHDPYPYPRSVDMVHAVYDRIGPTRLVWGSDFPHVLFRTGYRGSLKWLDDACPFLSADDLRLILGDNARRLYWPARATNACTE